MASQQEKFRKAAWAYVAYGVCYLGGALYLAAMGIAPLTVCQNLMAV